jgi:iron complex outermembrane receptor protein
MIMIMIKRGVYIFMFAAAVAVADTCVVERAELVVRSEEMHSGAVVGQDASVAVTLEATPGVIVNSQGVAGGQSDLSIRGSSFSGAGLSIAGVSMRSPQTEHFNAELPIVAGVLSAPQVLTGFDQILAVEGHLVGTASFEIMPVSDLRSFTVGIAEENGYWLSMLMQEGFDLADGSGRGGVGFFGSHTEMNAVDYDDNDLKSSRGGGRLQFLSDDSKLDLVAAYQTKEFGARGYYGVTPDWYADEETEDALILGSWLKGDTEGSYIRSSVMRREQSDGYTLYWDFPGVYNNEHRTLTHSGAVGGRSLIGEKYVVDWRGSVEDERIRSVSLGNHERAHGSGLLLPGMFVGNWVFKGGLRYEMFEGADSEIMPQGAAEVFISDDLSLRLSHSQSMRQPSYTELNYESPASLGNAGLENQKSETTDLRAVGLLAANLDWHLAIFRRITFDSVDWIRATSESKRWTAENIGRIDTDGVECGLSVKSSGGSRASASYTFLHKSTDAELYSSRYAMDYPEHYLMFSGLWQISRPIGLELTQTFRNQAENPLRDSSDSAYNAFLALHLVPVSHPHLQISLMVSNLWDDDYEYFPGQAAVSPRRVSLGMTLDW